MNPTGIQVNKPALVVVLLVISAFIVYKYPYIFHLSSDKKADQKINEGKSENTLAVQSKTENRFGATKNTRKMEKEIAVVSGKISVKSNGQNFDIVTQTSKPDGKSKGDVLFLHGQAFSSQTWVDLNTLSLVASLGFNAVAIDLPNSPHSKSSQGDIKDHAQFLEDVIEALKLHAPVIVSPSMSGFFSLPYLFKLPEKVLERASGFVPVAPVSTGEFTKEQYQSLKIPTVIVCGDRDSTIGPTSVQNLSNLPSHKLHMIKDAGHAAYMNKPEEFHTILKEFLQQVYSS